MTPDFQIDKAAPFFEQYQFFFEKFKIILNAFPSQQTAAMKPFSELGDVEAQRLGEDPEKRSAAFSTIPLLAQSRPGQVLWFVRGERSFSARCIVGYVFCIQEITPVS